MHTGFGCYCSFDVFGFALIVFMLFFAFIGYGMRKLKFDPAPLPLAFVLGPMVERSLRQSLLISGGDLTIFVTRPISGTLIVITVLLVAGQAFFYLKKMMRR